MFNLSLFFNTVFALCLLLSPSKVMSFLNHLELLHDKQLSARLPYFFQLYGKQSRLQSRNYRDYFELFKNLQNKIEHRSLGFILTKKMAVLLLEV
jgi:hypothetical protein